MAGEYSIKLNLAEGYSFNGWLSARLICTARARATCHVLFATRALWGALQKRKEYHYQSAKADHKAVRKVARDRDIGGN